MRWFEEEMKRNVMTKAAAFYTQIRRPLVEDIAPPEMSKEAAAGEQKLQKLFLLMKQGQLEEEDLMRAAEVDPQIQAAMDYEQALNENTVLREVTTNFQQQQQEMQQQMAMQQQQLMAAQQQMMAQGQQLEMERAGKQQAIEQAIQSKDQQLATIVEQQQHRQQVMEAADALSQQLKQVAATSPSEQQAMMQQQQQQAAAMQQQAAMAAMPKKTQKAMQEAQNAEAEAQEQAVEAEQQAAQEMLQQGIPQQGMTVQASANPILSKLAKNVRVTNRLINKIETQRAKQKAAELAKTSASNGGCLQFMGLADAPVNRKTPEYGEKVTSTSHMYKEAKGNLSPKVQALLERIGEDPRETSEGGALIQEVAEHSNQEDTGPVKEAAPKLDADQVKAVRKYLTSISKPTGITPYLATLGIGTAGGAAAGAIPYARSGGGKHTLPDKKRIRAIQDAEDVFEKEIEGGGIPSAKSIHKLRKAELGLAESRRKQEDLPYGIGTGAMKGLAAGAAGTAILPYAVGAVRALRAKGQAPKFLKDLIAEGKTLQQLADLAK